MYLDPIETAKMDWHWPRKRMMWKPNHLKDWCIFGVIVNVFNTIFIVSMLIVYFIVYLHLAWYNVCFAYFAPRLLRSKSANLSFDRCSISHQLKQTCAMEMCNWMYFSETDFFEKICAALSFLTTECDKYEIYWFILTVSHRKHATRYSNLSSLCICLNIRAPGLIWILQTCLCADAYTAVDVRKILN